MKIVVIMEDETGSKVLSGHTSLYDAKKSVEMYIHANPTEALHKKLFILPCFE